MQLQACDRMSILFDVTAKSSPAFLSIAEASPISINRLANLMVMNRTALTRDLGLLSKQGWVRIEVDEDHRLRVVTLTEEGQRVLAQALPLWQQAQSQMLDRLGPQHLALLAELSTTTTPNH